MVFQNGFSLGITSSTDHEKIKRGESNYVALPNGTEYQIELSNTRSTDAMVEVYVEGDSIGTWFIPAHDRITIERPADTARKFTFFSEGDSRATQAGVVYGAENNGLVKAVFYPKQRYINPLPFNIIRSEPLRGFEPLRGSEPLTRDVPFRSLNIPMSSSTSRTVIAPQYEATSSFQTGRSEVSPRYRSGSTVLGQSSSQDFRTMRRFTDAEIDWSNVTTIMLRLVVRTQPVTIQPGYISIAHRNTIPPRIETIY